MKFSIIVPIYNVEKYIEKCLQSIKDQTFKNFEVIMVDDGSTDNSNKIMKLFEKDKRFKSYSKKNGGLSDARNYGIQYTSGDYLLFIDSDDYIDKKLLETLEDTIKKAKADTIKFNIVDVINGKEYKHFEKLDKNKKVDLKDLIGFDYFEPACSYCYNLNFYKENNFKFEVGRYHEDYGLIPLILLKSSYIYYLNYFGYYYVKRENSIVNSSDTALKRAEDTLYFSIKNIDIIKNGKSADNETKSLLLNFYANGAINRLRILNDKKGYLKQLKLNKIHRYLLNKSYKQKIKKMICKISYNLYIKLF